MPLDPAAENLFHELASLGCPERVVRLDQLFPGGGPTREEIESLLRAADGRDPGFLAIPPGRAPIDPPSFVGKYRVRGELGRGGSGIVYLADDPDLGRSVAIKVLATSARQGAIADRLRAEGRSVAAVQHPNVAQVYTLEEATTDHGGTRSSLTFLTLEYVPGETLADRLRAGPMHLEEALECARQIATAIEAAHRRRVLHRDLKPANIKVTQDGWIKVLDFGLARVLDEAARAGEEPRDRTRRNRAISHGGTPGYMSPEQCRGEDLDGRTDLWSFGAILYESLVGHAAVRAETVEALFEANREGRVDLEAIPRSVPARVRDLIQVCLASDRGQRDIDAITARQILEDELLRMRAGTFAETRAPGPPREDDRDGLPEPRARGNLPIPLSRFVGREDVIGRIEALIPYSRLLTLTGPGGVGKTRTALQLGARVASRFPAGAWFVELSEMDPSADVTAAAARSLRIREVRPGATGDLLAMLARAFSEAPGLLILDNCEHVLEQAARFVADLLARAAGLTIIATSRESLGIAGEQIVPLAPFSVPRGEDDDSQARESDAVELFLQRARARSSRFDASGGDVDLVRDLCRRLDGLPLAIELAASHAGSLSIEEIHHRVLEGLPLPTVGASTAASRHRSIRDLIDWSHRLLSPGCRILFRRLSIFRGGWTLADAEAVCAGGGIEAWQVYELLAVLIDKSLVQVRDEPPGEGEATRYYFLETIRSFAADRLEESEREQERLEVAYLRHLLASTDVRPEERGPTRAAWVHRIEPDYPNALHAIELALTSGRIGDASALAGRMGPYWLQMGYWTEGQRWIDRVVSARDDPDGVARHAGVDAKGTSPESSGREEILFLNQAARLASMTGEVQRAEAFVSEALRIAEALGEPGPVAGTLLTAGVCAWFRTDLDAAAGFYERSRALHERIGDKAGLAVCIANLGAVHSARGAHEIALPLHEEHRRLAREMGDPLAEAKSLLNLARTALILDQTAMARSRLEEALPILREHRDLHSVAQALHSLGDLDLKEGRHAEARGSLLESGRLRLKLGDRPGLSSVLGSVARVELESGDVGIAVALLSGILVLFESGQIPVMRSHLDEARTCLAEARERLTPGLAAAWEERGRGLDLPGLVTLVERESTGGDA